MSSGSEKIKGGPFSFILLHNLILIHTQDKCDAGLFNNAYEPEEATNRPGEIEIVARFSF